MDDNNNGQMTKDPATIAKDVRHTQDAIGDTVERLEEKLTPSEITRSVMGDDGQEFAREVIRLVQRNPIPAALFAVGAIWLFASSGSTLSKFTDKITGKKRGDSDLIPRSEEPAPIGPPPETGREFDHRRSDS